METVWNCPDLADYGLAKSGSGSQTVTGAYR